MNNCTTIFKITLFCVLSLTPRCLLGSDTTTDAFEAIIKSLNVQIMITQTQRSIIGMVKWLGESHEGTRKDKELETRLTFLTEKHAHFSKMRGSIKSPEELITTKQTDLSFTHPCKKMKPMEAGLKDILKESHEALELGRFSK